MRWHTCNNASTYAAGSAYSSNLDKVMGDLVNNAPETGFNTTFYGQSANSTVYGLLQCEGKISQQDCAKCSREARDRLLTSMHKRHGWSNMDGYMLPAIREQ